MVITMGYIDLFTNKPLSVSSLSDRNLNYTINNNHDNADAYIIGVPFDSTTSYRPGARFGPNAIREALLNIEFNSLLDHSKSLECVRISDVGNIKNTTKPEVMIDMLNKVVNELVNNNRLIGILGGEHLLTLASYNAIADYYSSNKKDVMLVVFDAHLDLRDEFNDCKLNHATYLHRVIESKGNDGSNVVHIGARGFAKDELYYASNTRVNLLMAKDILLDYNTAISRLKDIIASYDDAYISIDLDAIDPAFAKGVGTPEPFGLTPIQMLELLSLLKDKRIRCFDIVELCPPCDDGSTAILAAKFMLELILLSVNK